MTSRKVPCPSSTVCNGDTVNINRVARRGVMCRYSCLLSYQITQNFHSLFSKYLWYCLRRICGHSVFRSSFGGDDCLSICNASGFVQKPGRKTFHVGDSCWMRWVSPPTVCHLVADVVIGRLNWQCLLVFSSHQPLCDSMSTTSWHQCCRCLPDWQTLNLCAPQSVSHEPQSAAQVLRHWVWTTHLHDGRRGNVTHSLFTPKPKQPFVC